MANAGCLVLRQTLDEKVQKNSSPFIVPSHKAATQLTQHGRQGKVVNQSFRSQVPYAALT